MAPANIPTTRILFSIIFLAMLPVRMALTFHGGDALACRNCHTMHFSDLPDGTEGGPFEHLSVRDSTTKLCMTCHDGKAGTPDVFGPDDANSLTERVAGFFAPVDVDNINGHDLALDRTRGDPNPEAVGCIDCHDPHGKSPDDSDYKYRNLQWTSDPNSEPAIRAYVNPTATGLDVYEQRNIGYTAPSTKTSDWREVTSICFGCHRDFKSDSYTRTPDGVCIRHPSIDSERGVWEPINRRSLPSTDPAHWKSSTSTDFGMARLPFIAQGAEDYAEAAVVAQDNQVFCLTCHKAHGSGYRSSLRWPSDSGAGCQQCHNKG